MTTINNIADLARILREQPEWAEAIRSLVLSKELLELPDTFAELAARVNNLTDQMADLNRRFAEFVEFTNRNFEAVNRRLDNLESDMAEVKSDVAELKSDMVEVKSDVAELKSDMVEVKSDVAELKSDMVELKSDVAELKTRTGNLESAVDRLQTSVNQVNGRLDNGLGMNYELKVGRNIGSIANQHLDIRRVRALSAANIGGTLEFTDMMDDAQDQGRITREQSVAVQRLDLVFRGQRNGEDTPTLVAAEISITVGDSDIVRVAERAALLEQASQMPVVAAVVGTRIDEARAASAASRGVAVVLVPDE